MIGPNIASDTGVDAQTDRSDDSSSTNDRLESTGQHCSENSGISQRYLEVIPPYPRVRSHLQNGQDQPSKPRQGIEWGTRRRKAPSRNTDLIAPGPIDALTENKYIGTCHKTRPHYTRGNLGMPHSISSGRVPLFAGPKLFAVWYAIPLRTSYGANSMGNMGRWFQGGQRRWKQCHNHKCTGVTAALEKVKNRMIGSHFRYHNTFGSMMIRKENGSCTRILRL